MSEPSDEIRSPVKMAVVSGETTGSFSAERALAFLSEVGVFMAISL